MADRRRSRQLVVAAGVALLGLLAGCGGGDGTSGSATPVVPGASVEPTGTAAPDEPMATATSTPTATTGGAREDETGGSAVPTSQDDVVVEGLPAAATAVLTAIRAAEHEGYDRVVLEFDGPVAGYVVRQVEELTSDPEGLPVEHGGTAALQVIVQGATLDTAWQVAEGETARRYTGPDRVSAALPAVQDVVRAGDWEATLSLGVGVTARTAFAVSALADPTRIVIDVAH